MASSISAGTTSSTALVATADTTGALVLQTNNGTTALTLSTAQNATFAGTLTTAAKGIAAASLPTGSVLQVLNTTTVAAITTTSTSFVTTSFSLSITPTSSSSKILVFVNGGGGYTGGVNVALYATVYRGATNLGDATYGLERIYAGAALIAPHSMSVLDSPATTSSTTYTCYFRSNTGAQVDFSNSDRGTVSLTLMEIAA